MPGSNPFLEATAAPAILEARSWLERYDGALGPPMDLSQAAPPYSPDPELLECIAAAAADPAYARYGTVRGEMDLRIAYGEHLLRLYGGPVDPDNVTITAGCNQAFFIIAVTLLRQDDVVLLPSPWYFNHKMTLDMLGIEARPLICRPESGYLPNVDAAAAAMDDRVRAVVLVTPNNPTGAEYPPDLIERFATLCREKGVWLILDETYRDFRRDTGAPYGLAERSWPEGVVSLYSFSKGYAIPGHRLGAITAPISLAPDILKVQDCVQICAGRAIQVAMTWGLGHLDEWREARREEVLDACDRLPDAVRDTGWTIESSGAYFAYLRHPFEDQASAAVAAELATRAGVLLIPGSSSGIDQERHLRLSLPTITEAARPNSARGSWLFRGWAASSLVTRQSKDRTPKRFS